MPSPAGSRPHLYFDMSEPPQNLSSRIVERSYKPRKNSVHPNYRMACYEYRDYQTIDSRLAIKRLNFKITIEDTTMQAYETYIRIRMRFVLSQVKRYLDDALEFCSYNSVDGRFNKFFIDAVNEKYLPSPSANYPWIDGPIYYLMFSSLMAVSRDSSTLRRKKTIQSIDVATIKKQAELLSAQIGPENGTIDALQNFYDDMVNFSSTWLAKNSGLDESNAIYESPTSTYSSVSLYEAYTLKNPQLEKQFDMTPYEFNSADISQFIAYEENSEGELASLETCKAIAELVIVAFREEQAQLEDYKEAFKYQKCGYYADQDDQIDLANAVSEEIEFPEI